MFYFSLVVILRGTTLPPSILFGGVFSVIMPMAHRIHISNILMNFSNILIFSFSLKQGGLSYRYYFKLQLC